MIIDLTGKIMRAENCDVAQAAEQAKILVKQFIQYKRRKVK